MKEGRLVAASCTTGWFDWIHGELWLFPDGMLRVRRSLLETALSPALASTTGNLPVREFENGEPEALSKLHRTNLLVEAREIASADLRTGLTTSRLRLELRDGRTLKLLWLKSEPAVQALQRALAVWGIQT